jgi:hypothetical protein
LASSSAMVTPFYVGGLQGAGREGGVDAARNLGASRADRSEGGL